MIVPIEIAGIRPKKSYEIRDLVRRSWIVAIVSWKFRARRGWWRHEMMLQDVQMRLQDVDRLDSSPAWRSRCRAHHVGTSVLLLGRRSSSLIAGPRKKEKLCHQGVVPVAVMVCHWAKKDVENRLGPHGRRFSMYGRVAHVVTV